MNVLIYSNKSKDCDGEIIKSLLSELDLYNISHELISASDLNSKKQADAIFVLGGDGTLLLVNEFANKNNIPLIGINTGKLGFLSEFESYEISDAVKLFNNGELKEDKRIAIEVICDGKSYIGLNDVYVQRFFSEDIDSILAFITIKAEGSEIFSSKGDGIVISTPTGSTAYSLSAGGSILTPGVDAFILTPISAHSLSQRPIVYKANAEFEVVVNSDVCVGVFVDGKCISKLSKGKKFIVKKADNSTVFFRKKDFNFFNRLRLKFNGDTRA